MMVTNNLSEPGYCNTTSANQIGLCHIRTGMFEEIIFLKSARTLTAGILEENIRL